MSHIHNFCKYMLIFHIQDSKDVSKELERLASQHLSRGLTLQPLLVYDQSQDQVTVYINNVRYPAVNLVRGVDMLFKTYMALNLVYPCESKNILLFFQRYVYDIKTKFDKMSPCVSSTMSLLSKKLP